LDLVDWILALPSGNNYRRFDCFIGFVPDRAYMVDV